MIDKDKSYRTRSGAKVRLYALDGYPGREIHGAFLQENGWKAWTWDSAGMSVTLNDWLGKNLSSTYKSPFDLVEDC